MIDFISWNKTDDAAFRAYYLEKTGESIQAEPLDDDTKWQVGSGRLTPAMLGQLHKFAGMARSNIPTAFKGAKQLAAEAESLASLNK